MKKYVIAVFALLILTTSVGAWAQAPSISAFQPVSWTGISAEPITLGVTGPYNLTMSNDAKLTIGGNDYFIQSIWGFFAIGYNFTADGANNSAWNFDTNSNPSPYMVAGWINPSKSEAILEGQSKAFNFTQLQATGSQPFAIMGLHVSLWEPATSNQPGPFGGGWTGAVYQDGGRPIEVVPEASTLVGFGSALMMAAPGLVGWLRKRRA